MPSLVLIGPASDLLLTFLDWPAIQLIAAQLSVRWKSRDTRIPLQAAPGSRVEMLDITTISVIII